MVDYSHNTLGLLPLFWLQLILFSCLIITLKPHSLSFLEHTKLISSPGLLLMLLVPFSCNSFLFTKSFHSSPHTRPTRLCLNLIPTYLPAPQFKPHFLWEDFLDFPDQVLILNTLFMNWNKAM